MNAPIRFPARAPQRLRRGLNRLARAPHARRARELGVVLACCMLLAMETVHALGLPPQLAASEAGLREIGRGEMRWLGFKLYDAALWARVPGAQAMDDEYVLSIRYARAVSSERLVELSLEEMRRLDLADEPTLARWAEALAAALPSVAAGETLSGLHRPGRGAAFWHDGRATAELDDPALAQAFFAIWLDERTRAPALRARLLGLADGAR